MNKIIYMKSSPCKSYIICDAYDFFLLAYCIPFHYFLKKVLVANQ